MSPAKRIIGLLTIACIVSGCSSYRVIYGPSGDERPPDVDWTKVVKPGDDVKITLKNSGKIEGEIVDTSADSFAVEAHDGIDALGRRQVELVQIGSEGEIRSIESRHFSVGKTMGLLVAIAAPIALLAVGMSGFTVWGAQ